jgi:hypothetical protein
MSEKTPEKAPAVSCIVESLLNFSIFEDIHKQNGMFGFGELTNDNNFSFFFEVQKYKFNFT